jgi:hypothetical protein
MMARERNGETANAARDGRSWNAANDAAVELPCESVSTLVAMVTGGRARARSECWRRDETVCFSAEPPAAPSLSLRVFRALHCGFENRHQPTRTPGHGTPGADFKTKLAKSRDIFAAPLERAALIARRASVAVRALPPVAMASRSVLRRGIAAFAEATRSVAAGNALARQGGVTANRYDAPA